ncbi:MAG: WGxxGxxG-CTERM domain-containing protein, partial [Chloroflexi bacterium]|nr:WGxxGxxG-CTERM domain-containing protein [Chloroflexota bacterium]
AQSNNNDHNYGWIGLIGLAGLAGLSGRKRHDVHNIEHNARAMTSAAQAKPQTKAAQLALCRFG